MKFVHIADLHLDSPFVNLSDRDVQGDLRRLEQRKVLKKVIEYVKENSIEYLFISGDLYENKYVRKSTIEYVNNLFKEIPNTKIFISPGNHDPFLKNSYYNSFIWSDNVKIFTSKIEKVETEETNIYGYGFDDFYCMDCGIKAIEVNDKDKINILVMHGDLDTVQTGDMEYNPLSKKELESKGFDYIALGHIHKRDYNSEENQRIVYPGSAISLGFDELGQHGMIVGDVNKQDIKLTFIALDEHEFQLYELDVTDSESKEDLVEKINDLKFGENSFIEIVLVGKRNFEIDKYEIYKLISNEKVLKIKDNTKIKYNLDQLSDESTLKGLFASEMKKKLEADKITSDEKKLIEKAIEIGLDILE